MEAPHRNRSFIGRTSSRIRGLSRSSIRRSTSGAPEAWDAHGNLDGGGDVVGGLGRTGSSLVLTRGGSTIQSRLRMVSDPPPPRTPPPPRPPPPPPYAPPPLDPLEEAQALSMQASAQARAVVRRRTLSGTSPGAARAPRPSPLPLPSSLPPPPPPPLASCRVKLGGLVTVACAVPAEGGRIVLGISAARELAPPFPFDKNDAEWFYVGGEGECVGPVRAGRLRSLIGQVPHACAACAAPGGSVHV